MPYLARGGKMTGVSYYEPINPNDPKQKKSWGGFGYLILIVIAILVAYFVVLPLGLQVRQTFQTLDNAVGGKTK